LVFTNIILRLDSYTHFNEKEFQNGSVIFLCTSSSIFQYLYKLSPYI